MVQDIVQELGYLTLGTRLKRIGERLQAETQRILAEHDLDIPTAQFPFLAAIDSLGPLTVGELARSVGISQPGATRTVSQLEESGLLEPCSQSDDQRCKRLGLTAKGKKLVAVGKRVAWPRIERAVREVCHELDGSLLEQLTALEERLTAEPLLRRISKGKKS